MRKTSWMMVLFALVLAAPASGDDDDKKKRATTHHEDDDRDERSRSHREDNDKNNDKTKGKDEDDDYDDQGEADDDGAEPDEKPDEAEHRKTYLSGEKKKLEEAAKSDGAMTDDDKRVVRLHWTRAMVLIRIRHIATLENDKPNIARADAILLRLDKETDGKLRKGGAK
jgi:hypothetical protein